MSATEKNFVMGVVHHVDLTPPTPRVRRNSMSFKAIDSPDPTDDTQWLTYWCIFALFSITENVMSFLVEWIPFYYMIKVAFFTWLYHPKFNGATLMYKQIVQ